MFEKLQEALCTVPVLTFPMQGAAFVVGIEMPANALNAEFFTNARVFKPVAR